MVAKTFALHYDDQPHYGACLDGAHGCTVGSPGESYLMDNSGNDGKFPTSLKVKRHRHASEV